MRVYEFAKNNGVSSGEVLAILSEANFVVKSHMAVLGEEEYRFLQLKFRSGDKKKLEELFVDEEQPVSLEKKSLELDQKKAIKKEDFNMNGYADVEELEDFAEVLPETETFFLDEENQFDEDSSDLAKRQKRKTGLNKDRGEGSFFVKRKKRRKSRADDAGKVLTIDSQKEELFSNRAYSLAQIAKAAGWTPMQTVSFFLRKGKAYALNDFVSANEIKNLANEIGITLKEKEGVVRLDKVYSEETLSSFQFSKRPPVVVIMGHVDHGKTTLIDFILKSNIASKEKGGITQSIRLHTVKTSQSSFLLIDTPGHEAFSLMRSVGAKITDIAVIIIAADDGIKPQTIESINIAKAMGATIFVAINKIDKENAATNIDKIKQDLARYDLIIEEWGGNVVCSLISAKTGQGVSDLFEMIALQAELLDLKTTENLPAQAFVLESYIEKGLGVCATIILTQGQLKIGDNFFVGRFGGKVKALFDLSSGKKISTIKPYVPCKIVGIPEIVDSGELLKFVKAEQIEKTKTAFFEEQKELNGFVPKLFESNSIKVILKADSFSVLSALTGLTLVIKEKNIKFKGMIDIVDSSVGNIYEKDVETAFETGAVILGMNVSVEKKALDLSLRHKVTIKIDAIIYRLAEHLEFLVIEKLKSMKELKQVGKGFVKKVFDIKGRGIIAGCEVTEGSFFDKGIVFCMRNGSKIGEGRVTSLQQNKKVAKEIIEGQDCGFISQGFSGWREGDRVICFNEVSVY